jgi:hypothetical protein
MTGSIAGEHSWVYIWDKETKHDHFSGSLAMRAFRRGHLLYHPSPGYEARYLRTRALDHVELHARNVGHNYRGQPGLTTSDPSKLVGFSSFAAALLLFAQLKTNFGLTGRASPPPRTIPNLGGDDPALTRGPRCGRAIASCQCSVPASKLSTTESGICRRAGKSAKVVMPKLSRRFLREKMPGGPDRTGAP